MSSTTIRRTRNVALGLAAVATGGILSQTITDDKEADSKLPTPPCIEVDDASAAKASSDYTGAKVGANLDEANSSDRSNRSRKWGAPEAC